MRLRRPITIAAFGVLVAFGTACLGGTSSTTLPPLPTISDGGGPTKTGSPLPKALTHVVIDQSVTGHYANGAKSFVRITGGGLHRTLTIPSTGSRLLDLHRVATYTVRSYQQPCRSTCEHLQPPTDGCGTTFAASGEVVRITIEVVVGVSCTISRS